MTEQEAVKRFCLLSHDVVSERFEHTHSADCFCGQRQIRMGDYRYSEEVMKFIEDAVRSALDAHKAEQ